MRMLGSAPLLSFVIALVVLSPSLAKDKGNRFLNRMQNVAGAPQRLQFDEEVTSSPQPEGGKKRHRRSLQTVQGAFDKWGEDKLAFIHSAQKNGVNPIALFQSALDQGALKSLFENVEVQHKLLEAVPMLSAIPGFKQISGRRLSNEETAAGFAQGTKGLIDLMKNMDKTAKDPAHSFNIMANMRKSEDPEMKELFALASQKDNSAIEVLQSKLAEQLFPGIDMDRLQEVHSSTSLEKLASLPELAAFIDVEKSVKDLFRTVVA